MHKYHFSPGWINTIYYLWCFARFGIICTILKKNTYGTKVSRKVSRLNVESKSENYQKIQKNRLEWLAQITSASSFWRGASSLENFSLNKHNDVKFIVEKKLLIIVAWCGAVLLDGKIKNALKGLWGSGGRGDGGDEFKMGGSHMCYP